MNWTFYAGGRAFSPFAFPLLFEPRKNRLEEGILQQAADRLPDAHLWAIHSA